MPRLLSGGADHILEARPQSQTRQGAMETQSSAPVFPRILPAACQTGVFPGSQKWQEPGDQGVGSTRPVQLEAQPLSIPTEGPSLGGQSSKSKPCLRALQRSLPPTSPSTDSHEGEGVPGKQGGVSYCSQLPACRQECSTGLGLVGRRSHPTLQVSDSAAPPLGVSLHCPLCPQPRARLPAYCAGPGLFSPVYPHPSTHPLSHPGHPSSQTCSPHATQMCLVGFMKSKT